MCDWSVGWSFIQTPIRVHQHQLRFIAFRSLWLCISAAGFFFFFCLKPSVTFQARRSCWSGAWEKKGDVKEERSYFPIRDRFPYGRSRCDFILYSASALLAFPWRLNAVIREGRTILKRFYREGAAIKPVLWLKYWVQRSIYSVFYTYMYYEN